MFPITLWSTVTIPVDEILFVTLEVTENNKANVINTSFLRNNAFVHNAAHSATCSFIDTNNYVQKHQMSILVKRALPDPIPA